ncbi:energy transducer TonB [Parabacteroides pacaensis]|uniref:energy transducer TonB n=1 Tax=Parabacteroides pacaensis TaxID=2086575 RepID=UPI000D10787C|nr:energy transducer TonB [Parabacteroides pacaensis]
MNNKILSPLYITFTSTLLLLLACISGSKQNPPPSVALQETNQDTLTREQTQQLSSVYAQRLTKAFAEDSGYITTPPGYFGGMYYNDKGKLVVQIIGDTLEGRCKIAEIVQSNDFEIDPVSHTYSQQELFRIMDEFNRRFVEADSQIKKNFSTAAVNTSQHRIDIHLIITNKNTEKEFRTKVMNSPAFHFVKTDYGLAPQDGVSEINGLYLRTEYPLYHTSTPQVKVTFYNRSNQKILVGNHYLVAYEENGRWKIVPNNYAATDVEYIVNLNNEHSFQAALLPDIHPNKPGRYRIYYTVSSDYNPSKHKYNLVADFRLSADRKECSRIPKSDIPAPNLNIRTMETENAGNELDENEDIIYAIAEQMPEFPGGEKAMFNYLQEKAKQAHAEEKGRVVVNFLIGKDGIVRQPEIARSVNNTLDQEAFQIIRNMPKWQPARQQGKPVVIKYTVPILFEPTK